MVSGGSARESGHVPSSRDAKNASSDIESELTDGETRLREMVARYELDPDTIEPDSLESVKKVMIDIYSTLRNDAKSPGGTLAENDEVWTSLQQKYQRVFTAATKLRPTLKHYKELESRPALTATELDDAADRMAERRQGWLVAVTEFQQELSAFFQVLSDERHKRA
jgi:hypothetical protein